MWPPGHLAVAYLLTTAQQRRGTDEAVAAAAVGSQAPDLVDKPLAWYFGLVSGRTVAHSLLFVVPVVAVALLLASRLGHDPAGIGLAIGLVSHVVADAVPAFWDSTAGIWFLLWPIRSATPYDQPFPGVIELLVTAAGDPYLLFEIGVFTLAVVSWRREGYPGSAFLPRVE